jgi:hypothetical protein
MKKKHKRENKNPSPLSSPELFSPQIFLSLFPDRDERKKIFSLSRMGDANTGQVSLSQLVFCVWEKTPTQNDWESYLKTKSPMDPSSFLSHSDFFPLFPPPLLLSHSPLRKEGKRKRKKKGGKKKEESSHNWCWLALTRKNEPAIIQKFSFLQRNWMECIFGKKKEKNELNFLEPGPIPPSPRGGLLFAKKTPPRRRGHSWF